MNRIFAERKSSRQLTTGSRQLNANGLRSKVTELIHLPFTISCLPSAPFHWRGCFEELLEIPIFSILTLRFYSI